MRMHSGGEHPCSAAHLVAIMSARCLVQVGGRQGASEAPACFHHSSQVSPQVSSVRPCLQPTSAAQGVLHFDSALGKTCQGPAGGDAELWQEVYPQGLAA